MSVSASAFGALGDKFLADTFVEFKQTIAVNDLSLTDDDQGGYSETWSTFATVGAFVLPKSGDEKIAGGRLSSENMYTFHMKPIDGITNKMKITYNSEDYQIRSIKDVAEADQVTEPLDCKLIE